MANPRILIVDDESIVALDLRARLERLGYAVAAVASSGEEAVGEAEATRPDLVLMDIRMPGAIDGIEAAGQIRERFDIPTVYVTAYGDEETVQRAKLTRPMGYVLKPFSDNDLRAAIEVSLYGHRVESGLRQKVRELRALNELFQRHLNERYQTEEVYGRLAEGFMELTKRMQALSEKAGRQKERMQTPPIEQDEEPAEGSETASDG